MASGYTVVVGHQSLALDADEGGYYWPTLPPPLCPQCGESLGAFNDEDTRRAMDTSRWWSDQRVGCATCTWEAQVQG
jgi:hypothetical protein